MAHDLQSVPSVERSQLVLGHFLPKGNEASGDPASAKAPSKDESSTYAESKNSGGILVVANFSMPGVFGFVRNLTCQAFKNDGRMFNG